MRRRPFDKLRTDESDRDESPRRAVNPSYTRFRNPNLNNEDDDMGGMNYSTSSAGNSGGYKSFDRLRSKERHASPGDEYGVPDTDHIPDETNANTGYLRPKSAEVGGSAGPSPSSVHAYALQPRKSYRER